VLGEHARLFRRRAGVLFGQIHFVHAGPFDLFIYEADGEHRRAAVEIMIQFLRWFYCF